MPDHAKPCKAMSDQTRPDQTKPDQTRPGKAGSYKVRLDRARQGQVRSNCPLYVDLGKV